MNAQKTREIAQQQQLKYAIAQTSEKDLSELNLVVNCTELAICAEAKVLVAAYQGHCDTEIAVADKYNAEFLQNHFEEQGYKVTQHTSPLAKLYLKVFWE